MQINIYPHLSAAKSMSRYASGLLSAFERLHVPVKVWSTGKLNFWNRYPKYFLTALRYRTSNNIILSERFSFLLVGLKRNSSIVICHDLVALHQPNISFTHKLWYRFLLRQMNRASFIVCISKSTRKDLLQFEPSIREEKISVVYNGLEPYWNPDKQNVSSKKVFETKHAGRRFFLLVGTDAWNKNIESVLAALVQIDKLGARLVKVGALSVTHKKTIHALGMQNVVHHVENISDEELKWLYQNAIALIFPSYFEGFGWPALEAMACGCPVIASRTSSVPEVCGDAAWYIDPYDSQTIIVALESLTNDEKKRKEMQEKGFIQASRFSWVQTARNFVNLLDQ